MFTRFDKRMKAWEGLSKQKLPKELPIIIRLDGKKFSKWTKGLTKPHCQKLENLFKDTVLDVVPGLQNIELVYHQSDEVSLLMWAKNKEETDLVYNGNVQKLTSISSSLFTGHFNQNKINYEILKDKKLAFFDSRAFSLSVEEVNNYFYWRWQDCVRNAISCTYRYAYGHKKMHNMTAKEMKKELDTNSIPIPNINGTFFFKTTDEQTERKKLTATKLSLYDQREVLDEYLEDILLNTNITIGG